MGCCAVEEEAVAVLAAGGEAGVDEGVVGFVPGRVDAVEVGDLGRGEAGGCVCSCTAAAEEGFGVEVASVLLAIYLHRTECKLTLKDR